MMHGTESRPIECDGHNAAHPSREQQPVETIAVLSFLDSGPMSVSLPSTPTDETFLVGDRLRFIPDSESCVRVKVST
jgi:hypothetical protein